MSCLASSYARAVARPQPPDDVAVGTALLASYHCVQFRAPHFAIRTSAAAVRFSVTGYLRHDTIP